MIEALEDRRLLSSSPWGIYPRLIDQDVAVTSFPQIDGTGESIAVLDTGIDYTQAILGGGFGAGHKVIAGYNFVNNTSDPMDTDGHGTATAALIAGNGFVYSGSYYQGVAPGANLVALKVDDGSGNISDATYRSALTWVVNHRAQYNIVAINISEGGDTDYATKTTTNSGYYDVLAQLKAAGVFIACASGNDGVTNPPGVEYPAADPSAYAIGSINNQDAVSTFSSRGATLDLLAPGEQVPVPYLNSQGGATMLTADGTSFACPYAAGTAALLRQINSSFSPDQIMSVIQDSGQSVYDSGTSLSFKRLDLDGALSLGFQRSGQSVADIGVDGTHSDITFAKSGRMYLAYYDQSAGNLKYVTRSASNVWSTLHVIDDSADVGEYPSIALDKSSNPGIAYYDKTNANLKYAHFNGSTWSIVTLDTTGDVGQRPTLVYDKLGRPGISYYDATRKALKFVSWTGTAWVKRLMDSTANAGTSNSLALNAATGLFAIAYESHTTGLYRFAQQQTNGSWTFKTIDTTSAGGGYVSLAYDHSNRPAFTYYDSSKGTLKYARWDGAAWRIYTVASGRAQGAQLTFDSAGRGNITYYSQSTNSIFLAFGDSSRWTNTQLIAGGGLNLSAALSSADRLDVIFQQDGSDALHVGDFP